MRTACHGYLETVSAEEVQNFEERSDRGAEGQQLHMPIPKAVRLVW